MGEWHRMILPLEVLVWSLFVLAGCQSISGTARDEGAREADGILMEQGSIRSATGCELNYVVHRPRSGQAKARVVLAHGFMRSKERMAGLAEGLAGRGIPTVTLDLCNMRPWDGAHRQNGEDMRLLARAVGVSQVLYAGFSAGGLAALIAASFDPEALGVLALDLVDRSDLGVRAAADLRRPIYALVGEPGRCNARNNGLAVYAVAPRAQIRQVPGATHCDFEAPTDAFCRLLCESSPRNAASVSLVRDEIIDLAVRATEMLLANADCRLALSKSADDPVGLGRRDMLTQGADVAASAAAMRSTPLSLCLAARKKARL